MPNPVLAVAGIKGVGSAVQGSNAARGAKRAAAAQAQAAEAARALQERMYNEQVARQEPFRQAGLTSQNELMRQMGLSGDAQSAGYGNLLRDFGTQDFQADPGYAFRLQEGLKGLDRQAAARGGLISGAALKAASGYAGNQASAEYQNAFARYNQNRQDRYNMLSGQQNVGQNAANQVDAGGQQYATGAGNALIGAGNARASGFIGAANARNAMLGGLTNIGADLAGGYGTTWGQYASPQQGAAIQTGWGKWSDPTSNLPRVPVSY